MKVSMNWLKRYTDIPVSNAEYESRMVMSGTGVEGMEDLGAELENVVVGRVLTCENHPNSDHLHVCSVDVGDETLQIVCGAPNVAAGQLVPVAKIGARLPGDVKIKKGKLRGVESQGMICSGDEMGVPAELYPSVGAAGILVFNEDHPLGTDVRDIFGLKDTAVDFEILANRPDCLSVWGIARETAAVLKTPLRLPEVKAEEGGKGDIRDRVDVSVEDIDLCPRYAARVIENVKVGPSPDWLRQYLYAAGMRSINNVVDITNFVMLETGHPMHAFDLDKVKDRKIIVRRTRPGEKLTTLDGKKYDMTGAELAICDADGPTGLAGVMGGEESEITENTREVMFECASFDRTGIRLTTRRLGFRTEASGRFERGVSPRTVMTALERACQMVNELGCGDVVPGVIDIYPDPVKDVRVDAPVKYIVSRTGVDLTGEEMADILRRLYFDVTLEDGVLHVIAPEFRQDIEGKADISEEVLRLAGYERIPSTGLKGETTQGGLNAKLKRHVTVQDILTGLGFYETMTYSFISMKSLEALGFDRNDSRLKPVTIRNPLGEDTACLRTTMMPGLLKTVGTNRRAGNETGRIYELGNIYSPDRKTDEGLPVEKDTLALGVWGGDSSFYTVRGVAEAILRRVGVNYAIVPAAEKYLHPGRRAALVSRADESRVYCVLGQLHPDVAEEGGMDRNTFVCEMDLETVFADAKPMGHVEPIARFPQVARDLALVMDEDKPLGPLMDHMKAACGPTLEDIRLFDVFRGVQVGMGRKSAAFSLVLRAKDHTLTEEEINALVQKALKAAGADGAVLRA